MPNTNLVLKSDKNLITDEECCVCYENTKTAVQGCKHPVCKTCFKGMKRSGRTLACPMCRGNMRKLVKV